MLDVGKSGCLTLPVDRPRTSRPWPRILGPRWLRRESTRKSEVSRGGTAGNGARVMPRLSYATRREGGAGADSKNTVESRERGEGESETDDGPESCGAPVEQTPQLDAWEGVAETKSSWRAPTNHFRGLAPRPRRRRRVLRTARPGRPWPCHRPPSVSSNSCRPALKTVDAPPRNASVS